MAVKIRLRRIGYKKHPIYRVVVADSRRARDGKVIDAKLKVDALTADEREIIKQGCLINYYKSQM